MSKKLGILVFFSLLIITQAILNAKDANEAINSAEFLSKEGCKNHNLDNEICEFIKLAYSSIFLQSMYDAIYADEPLEDENNSSQKASDEPFVIFAKDLMQKMCKSFNALSEENLDYILSLNLAYKDVYTGEDLILSKSDINFLRNECREKK